MSTIDRLSIKGIRSFGIKPEDQQVIVFSSPLTLIVGSNGSGKTTIIECLKFALTGDLPPGSDKGKSFVHDPKIFDCPECLGQVKLLVKNLRNDKLTIARSIKTVFKRGKAVFETIDPGTITHGDGSSTKSITMRCVDVNKEMCQFMGVSKAIMNNVLFCHQEESDWPLDEAKKLKEKFDAIFGTTEYNKAIDKIIKLRKVQAGKLKEKEADLKVCAHLKKETDAKQLNLQSKEQKLEELKNTKKECESKMEPVRKRIEEIYKIQMEGSKLQAKKIELRTNLESCKTQSKNTKAKINSIFVGDLPELEEEIRMFKSRMSEKQIELKTSQTKHDKLMGELQKLQQTSLTYDRESVTLINERQREQDYLSERADKIKSLCNELKIKVDGDLEQSASYVESTMSEIAASFTNREKEISNKKKSHEDADKELQIKINKIIEEKASLESNIKSKKADKDRLGNERQRIQADVVNTERSANQITILNEEIRKTNEKYEELSQTMNVESLKTQIVENKELVDKLAEKYEKIDKTVDFLNSISKLTAEIDLKDKEFQKRESEMKRIRNKHSENLKKIFGNRQVESNFRRTLQTSVDMFQNQITDIIKQINSKKLREKELQILRKNQKDEITKLEKELEESKDKIYDLCHSTPYEEIVARTKETIELLQLDHGALKSSEAMYKKYIKKVEEDPCCPLCHKNMTDSEAVDLRTELSDEIHRLPDRIERAERQLKIENKKYEELLGLKSIIDRVQVLETNIPKTKQNLKRTEEQLTEATKDIESLQLTESEPSGLLELARNMLGDMSLLDEAMKDTTRLTNELAALKGKLPERTEQMSLKEAQREKSSLGESLRQERSRARELNDRDSKATNTLNKLRDRKNDLREQQIKLQERVQSLKQLKVRITEIGTQIAELDSTLKECEDKLKPAKTQLDLLTKQKEKLKEENRKIVQEMEKKLELLRRIDQDIKRYTDELNELKKKNLVEEIDRVKRKILANKEEKKRKEKEINEIQQLIETLKSNISKQEVQERDLKENKEYKILQKQQQELQEKYDELCKEIGDLDFSRLEAEKTGLAKKRDLINEEAGVISGKMGEVNNTINDLRKELNKSEYRDSMKNFRKVLYEVQVLEKLMADLAQYRSALDYALIKFHEEKMNKINRLIREFWRQIYRGNDIDYIQIKTEADEMKNEAVDKRRSYNYRVIQSKNNSEIDMRGRCSAGQRVLSSLIIRMALAETFSSNCGVLALDEPTTNLDRNNIHSLCEALNKIVDERQSQSNFMLIIITHDEEFIQTLGQVSTYHQVSRNVDGKSVIQKKRIQ